MGKYHDDLSDRENLVTIIQACDTIRDYIRDMDEDDFRTDQKTRDACLAQWIVIGERVAKLSDKIKEKNSDVPWKLIVGFKNRGSHSYGTRNFDNDMMWHTVNEDATFIRKRCNEILRTL